MAWECPQPETMADIAASLNEFYVSMKAGGFTRHEALHLIAGDYCCKRDDAEFE